MKMNEEQFKLSHYNLLRQTTELALSFLHGLPTRPFGGFTAPVIADEALPEDGEEPAAVVAAMARAAAPGLVASNGPRYFGFVTGGSLPAALAADWLTSAWDQNACLHVMSPAAAAFEATAAAWLVDLFGLPVTTSVGFTTGATMANFTALAAGRHALLQRLGWEVGERGLAEAPRVHVVVGAHVHASVQTALQMLGFGRANLHRVAVDDQGRMRVDALEATLTALDATCGSSEYPLLVCAQAGHVCTGAFDPLAAIADAVHAHGGWLHVDGAFGLWAAASPALAALTSGIARADSWATDAHKWLNVPYDAGVVMVRDRKAHRAATTIGASYLVAGAEGQRDGADWVPELSRRARGFTVYAALRSLGRRGVADLVERCCARARQMATLLAEGAGVTILNDVVLNQVLVRFTPADGGDADAFTREVIRRVQAEGTCWLGGTTWNDAAAMRVSISHWATSADDVARSAAAILRCAGAAPTRNDATERKRA
jgi:glutamate/tyrosine decarboxylase-like PLP-dependent enzyme